MKFLFCWGYETWTLKYPNQNNNIIFFFKMNSLIKKNEIMKLVTIFQFTKF